MAIKFLVRQGGAAAAQVDYADLTLRRGTPIFAEDGRTPLINMSQRWENGSSGLGQFTYLDRNATLPNKFRPHAEVKLIEDDSGNDYVLGWGRLEGGNDVGRISPYIAGDAVEHISVQVMDCNDDLRGIPFRNGWERPAETSWERLQALELASLNGSSSTEDFHRATTDIRVENFANSHLVDASDPVAMDAVEYPPGTFPADVLADIMEQWGRRWGVTIHHQSGASHKCLLVLDPEDHSSFSSALRINDQSSAWDPDDPTAPIVEPIWKRAAGKTSDNTEVISGLISIWSGTDDEPRHLYVETGEDPADWETWVDVYNDDKATSATQATRRANTILADRKRPFITHQPSILLNPEQVTLITAGQSIEVKSVVMNQGPDKYEWVWRRIAEINWEPNYDGRWWAHLSLERPRGAAGAASGPGGGQPGSTTPKPAPECPPVAGDVVDCLWEATDGDDATWPGGLIPSPGVGSSFDAQQPGFSPYKFIGSGQTTDLIADCSLTPGDTYHLRLECGSNSRYAYYEVFLNQNAGPSHVQIGPTVHPASTTAVLFTLEGTFTIDPSATVAAIQFGSTYGGWHYNVAEISHASTPPEDDDEFCIPEGSGGSSPFYARSDDPRFDNDDQHLTSKVQQRVTNTSGGALAIGDVVVPDITSDDPAVTTTTTAATTDAMVGIVTSGGDDDAEVTVQWSGVFTLPLNGTGTPVPGDYVYTSTTAGAVDFDATRSSGAVGRVIAVNVDDETVDVLWWGVPDGSGGGDLDDLGDVNAPSPSNGDVLTWDSTPGEWVSLAPGTGGGVGNVETGGAAVVIPDLLNHPSAVGVGGGGIDEEYDGTTGLTWSAAPGTEDADTTIPNALFVEWAAGGATEILGLRSWAPGAAAAFDCRAHVGLAIQDSANTAGAGLIVTSSGNTSRALLQILVSRTAIQLQAFTYAGGTYTQRGSTWNTGEEVAYLRITRDGSNNITFWWSPTGYLWNLVTTQAITFTPANLGYRLSANGAMTMRVQSNFLRTTT